MRVELHAFLLVVFPNGLLKVIEISGHVRFPFVFDIWDPSISFLPRLWRWSGLEPCGRYRPSHMWRKYRTTQVDAGARCRGAFGQPVSRLPLLSGSLRHRLSRGSNPPCP